MNDQIVKYERNVYLPYSDWESINRNRRGVSMQKMKAEREKRSKYYKHQRLFGLVLLVLAIIVLIVACANGYEILQGVGVVLALFGLYTMLTRQMILINEYYLECMDKINLM